MNSNDQTIQTIEQLHSQWSMVDKAAKLVWLKQQQNQLNVLASQMSYNISLRGGRMTDAEKQYAHSTCWCGFERSSPELFT